MLDFKKYSEVEEQLRLLVQHGFHIPRKDMPQIRSDLVPKYLDFLSEHGIKYTKKKIEVSNLKSTQGELDINKVIPMMDKDNEANDKPIIVSEDHYVLDGHHRFAALYCKDKKLTLTCYVIGLKIQDLLNITKEFDLVFFKALQEKNNS
ncbi:MAG: hypothetical protein PHC28_06695 [Flavobacterium sp.]|uniref:hypothetical protein n=1 Tax=Flavobacterium sp. TaxID=239 RepID=UPI002613064A|nr:hypothetical protein [Flavobacterium sp.]MDD5150158.1 hypothetical protein [Flavobacterium sp.]